MYHDRDILMQLYHRLMIMKIILEVFPKQKVQVPFFYGIVEWN